MAAAEGRATSRGDARRVLGAVCALVGLACFLFCTGHICMAGHMKHPPYPWWHYLNDGAWVVLFVAAAALSLGSNMAGKSVLTGGLVLLGLSRACGSLGGILLVLEAPAFLVVGCVAVVGLVRRAARPVDGEAVASDPRVQSHQATPSEGDGRPGGPEGPGGKRE